jgi:hypothetical protein
MQNLYIQCAVGICKITGNNRKYKKPMLLAGTEQMNLANF